MLLCVWPKLAQSISHTILSEINLCNGSSGCGLHHVGLLSGRERGDSVGQEERLKIFSHLEHYWHLGQDTFLL